jgi:hypothetical protein
MEPLSPALRRFYFLLFIALFFAMLPAVIFYADGWRYKGGYGFVRTGGIYISVPYQDADVYINGGHVGRSGFLDRNFYIGDLAPSAYIVHVEREGYRSWDRLLVVEQQLVSDARSLLIPEEISATRLVLATSTPSSSSTSTRPVTQSTLAAYTAIFAATTTASTTIPVDEVSGVGLFIEKGVLSARWIQDNAFPPSIFCQRPSLCVDAIILEQDKTVTSARFFRGGVAYVTKDGVIYFKEVDVRESPVFTPLFTIKNADIRVIDDTLVVKSGTTFYEISL